MGTIKLVVAIGIGLLISINGFLIYDLKHRIEAPNVPYALDAAE